MADICILGTSGTLPKVDRHLSSTFVRHNGHSVLFDCGEGTQIAIKKMRYAFKSIDVICISHFHADHVSGLAGLLLTMGNEGREQPVTIIAPKGGEQIVRSLLVIAPDIPFEVRVIECEDELSYVAFENVTIKVIPALHAIPCIAFSLTIKRDGRFDANKAKEKGVPMHLWNVIRREGKAEENGVTYYASDIMGDERKGIKITYITDTRPTAELVSLAEGSDLLICEGMFADPEKLPRAEKTGHMMFSEAAELAKDSRSDRLVLTHFSPSLPEPEEWLSFVRDIFSGTDIATDGAVYQINFDPR